MILTSCNKRRTRVIPVPQGHIVQNPRVNQPAKEISVRYKVNEKMQKVKNGEWKKTEKLTALCAEGNATCSNGGQALCYTGLMDEDFIYDDFADIAESSLPVCVTGDTVSYLIPACGGGMLPVCGLPVSAQETIKSQSVICDSDKFPGIVCPFGGDPACIEDVDRIFSGAYCVSKDANKTIISGKPKSGNSLYTIACKDKAYIPECYFEY